jgi:glycosyltransferase involved in cell wall biosynthesis
LRAIAKAPISVSLSVCGDGDKNYRRGLEVLASELDLSDHVVFYGQLEDTAKEKHFREVDWCIVPSFKENFCLVVAEALAHGVPVIASRGTPWSRLEEMGCGLWVDNDETSLADAITRASKMPRDEMGRRGREWMKREFSWSSIAEQMVAQYQALLESSGPVSVEKKVSRQAA